jgi:hypothetical protein
VRDSAVHATSAVHILWTRLLMHVTNHTHSPCRAFTENTSFENDTEAGNVSPRSSIAGRKIHTVMEIWEIYKKIDNDGSDSICVEELDLALEELGLAHDAETVRVQCPAVHI